jgi:hypothetical protein
MAHVRDVRLQLGTNQEFQNLAEVNFAVEFSQAEVSQNINFGLYVTLMQYDPRVMQQYNHLTQNGAYDYGSYPMGQGNGWNPVVGREQGILWIAREVIRPNGTKTQYFQRKCTFQKPTNGQFQNGNFNGQFMAHVSVIPEITEGRGWSNAYRLGQGQMPFGNHAMNGQHNFFNQEMFATNGAFATNNI